MCMTSPACAGSTETPTEHGHALTPAHTRGRSVVVDNVSLGVRHATGAPRLAATVLYLLSLQLSTSCISSRAIDFTPPENWGIVPLSYQDVVANTALYTTDKGRGLAVRHGASLQLIFMEIRRAFPPSAIEFWPSTNGKTAGLCFWRSGDRKTDERFLRISVVAPSTFFEKRASTYEERAAALFSSYVSTLIRIAANESAAMADPDLAGIWTSISWGTADATGGMRGEGLTVIATKDDSRRFADGRLPAQEFLNKARVMGIQEGKELGSVSLTVSPTPKLPELADKQGLARALIESGTELIAAKQSREAISVFDRAIVLDPNNPEAYYFRGSARASLAMPDLALKDVSSAVELAQEPGMMHYMTAGLAALRGKPDESCKWLRLALAEKFSGGIVLSSLGLQETAKNDPVFESVKMAPCFREVVGRQ